MQFTGVVRVLPAVAVTPIPASLDNWAIPTLPPQPPRLPSLMGNSTGSPVRSVNSGNSEFAAHAVAISLSPAMLVCRAHTSIHGSLNRDIPTGFCAPAVKAAIRAMKTALEVERIPAHLVVSRPRRQGGNVTAGGPDREDQTVRVGRSQYWCLWAILGKPGITAGHHEAGLWKKFVIR